MQDLSFTLYPSHEASTPGDQPSAPSDRPFVGSTEPMLLDIACYMIGVTPEMLRQM